MFTSVLEEEGVHTFEQSHPRSAPRLWTPREADRFVAALPGERPIEGWERCELKAFSIASLKAPDYRDQILMEHGGKQRPDGRWFFPRGFELPIAGGSFLRGTSVEQLYTSITNGTQLNTFTTEDQLQKTLPAIIIPAGFWFDASSVGKSLHARLVGRLGTTGTPTFTFTWRLLTTTTWSAAGVSMSSAAITAGSGVTLAPFTIELDIVNRAIVFGATGLTLGVIGDVRAGTAFAATGGVYSIPAANTAFTVTVDNTVSQYMFFSAACGTSSGSNLIQSEMIKVYGEN